MIVTDWQARHGLTAIEHQTAFNQLTSRGYRLVKITGTRLAVAPASAASGTNRAAATGRHGIVKSSN